MRQYTVGMEILGIDSEVGKEAYPHLFPFSAPPLLLSPTAAYLSHLAPSSRLTMAKLIRRLVKLLGSSSRAEEYPWSLLDYGTTVALRKEERLPVCRGCLSPGRYGDLRMDCHRRRLRSAGHKSAARHGWRLGGPFRQDRQSGLALPGCVGTLRPGSWHS